jgi:hypothetical protein
MSTANKNVVRIMKLELALAQIERQGKAAKVAYQRWQTEPLAAELKQLREAWTAYKDQLRAAKEESK